MTTWTERSAPESTSWTERSAPASTAFLERDFLLEKQASNFYMLRPEIVAGYLFVKQDDDFYEVEAVTQKSTASLLAGKFDGKFIQLRAR